MKREEPVKQDKLKYDVSIIRTQNLIFKDAHHIIIYFLGDVAFVPIEVLLVTLIIHKLLSEREKRARLKKLNMVIGAFFSEVGTQLLKYFSVLDPRIEEIRKELIGIKDYFEINFTDLNKRLKDYDYKIKSKDDYPYLFSLIVRTNPFDPGASPIVK